MDPLAPALKTRPPPQDTVHSAAPSLISCATIFEILKWLTPIALSPCHQDVAWLQGFRTPAAFPNFVPPPPTSFSRRRHNLQNSVIPDTREPPPNGDLQDSAISGQGDPK